MAEQDVFILAERALNDVIDRIRRLKAWKLAAATPECRCAAALSRSRTLVVYNHG